MSSLNSEFIYFPHVVLWRTRGKCTFMYHGKGFFGASEVV